MTRGSSLTRFAAPPLSTLSHIRACTLVFDELWGEGKKDYNPSFMPSCDFVKPSRS